MINNKKIEKQLISTLISNENILLEYFSKITIDMFFDNDHKKLAGYILKNKDLGNKVNYDTVEIYIEKQNSKIDVYDFTDVVGHGTIETHIQLLKEYQYKRELRALSVETFAHSDNKISDVFSINDKLNEWLLKLSNIITNVVPQSNTSLIRDAIKEIEFAKTSKGITGCCTGFDEVDKVTGGWQNGHLIIMAARPAMGKTSLAIAQALNGAIDHDKNILFFSLEMGAVELMKKQISLISEIPLNDLKNENTIDFQKLNKSITPIIDKGFNIVDNCFTLYDIKAQCRKENSIKKLDAIYIDYLQLIKHRVASGRSKENEVSEISRDLKLLAKELNAPIIALCQLSRAVETRGGLKMPQLSDLRDSGSIEQDADIVTFIYRPEYYDILEDEEGQSTAGQAMLIFAKNRHGATTKINLHFNAELTRFSNYEAQPFTAW